MATARELFFVKLRSWLVSGGRMTRNAWGSITRFMIKTGLSPREAAASFCPLEMD